MIPAETTIPRIFHLSSNYACNQQMRLAVHRLSAPSGALIRRGPQPLPLTLGQHRCARLSPEWPRDEFYTQARLGELGRQLFPQALDLDARQDARESPHSVIDFHRGGGSWPSGARRPFLFGLGVRWPRSHQTRSSRAGTCARTTSAPALCAAGPSSTTWIPSAASACRRAAGGSEVTSR